METGKVVPRDQRLKDLIKRTEFKIERNASPELKEAFELQKLAFELELELMETKKALAAAQEKAQAKPGKKK